jgi:hypothetical protein
MHALPALNPDCLAQLGRLLESLPVNDSATTISDNLALLNRIAHHDFFVPLTEGILNSPQLLAEIASRSYRHVNYFDKIVLVGSDKLRGYRLTLHLWCPPFSETELKKESLHDHRFSFWSAVLAGILVSENFTESPDGDLMQHYRYIPEKKASDVRNFYEFVGETRLVKRKPSQRRAGESYYQPCAGVHRVLLPQSLTCTLVLRGPRQKSFTNTFRTDIPKVRQIDNSMYSGEAVAEKLRALLNAIARKETLGRVAG